MAEATDDVIGRLRASLAGRYDVERELGAGGMATVYLARDVREDRQVAIKVLRLDLGGVMGPQRFLREIDVAAGLSHPNIMPLVDSGEAGGLLYYVMPYIAGESLEGRLAREVQLPVPDALAITRQVADALAYAHERGIIHRDIKPANIMLNGDTIVVADFGIARAIGIVSGPALTQTGMVLGTPVYMSPEQATAATVIDGRSDIYSLGCVLYEMLIGEPPFSGPTPLVIIARHSHQRVPGLRHVRDTIPPAVEYAVMKAMAKTPADRFATVTEFAEALSAAAPASPFQSSGMAVPRPPLRIMVGVAAAVAAVAVAATGALWYRASRPPAIDANAVAVMPFRAGGAGQTAGSVPQNLSDLLAERFSGEGGPKAVYQGTVLAAIADERPANPDDLTLQEAIRAGRASGAGLLLLGQAYRNGDRVIATASLVQVPGGEVRARLDEVSAPADSLPALADRIAKELLARSAGETGERLRALLATNLPALRGYLAAHAELRRGAYTAAARRFSASLDADSSFTLAALGLISTGAYLSQAEVNRGFRLARFGRANLGAGDALLLRAAAGPRNMGPGREYASFYADQVQAWEAAAAALPDRAEAAFGLGDALFHLGPPLGLANLSQRTSAALRRALELNPGHVPALGHLIDLYASNGDTALVRSSGRRYLALDSVGELADYYRWRIAVALSDQKMLERLRRRFDSLSVATLERIGAVTQLDGVALEDARRAADALRRKSTDNASGVWQRRSREIALNGGRPAEEAAIEREFMGATALSAVQRVNDIVFALVWDGDSARAGRLVAERAAAADRAALRRDADPFDPVFYDVCGVGLWRLAHGEARGVERLISVLRSARQPMDSYATGYIGVCAAVLEAQLAQLERRPDRAQRLEALDSLARAGPPAQTWVLSTANLTLARLLEARGDTAGALAATRRRINVPDLGESRMLVGLSTFLREEGRLAALTGDTAGAISAWRRYVALRSDPEPAFHAEADRARQAFTALLR